MAQEENERAAEYFQPPAKGHRVSAEEEQELAKQLYTVLNSTFPASALTSTNADAEGRGEDGRSARRNHDRRHTSVERSVSCHAGAARKTCTTSSCGSSRARRSAKCRRCTTRCDGQQLEQKLPGFFVRNRPLGMPLWQWIAIVLFVPIAAALGWLIALGDAHALRHVSQIAWDCKSWRRVR